MPHPNSQSARARYTVRYLEDTAEETTICGSRNRLLSTGDGTSVFAHLVRMREAAPHYHRQATELYYVLEGSGVLLLDGEEAALRPGACVEIGPGVVHAARGDVLVLVVGIPSICEEDTFFPEPGK